MYALSRSSGCCVGYSVSINTLLVAPQELISWFWTTHYKKKFSKRSPLFILLSNSARFSRRGVAESEASGYVNTSREWSHRIITLARKAAEVILPRESQRVGIALIVSEVWVFGCRFHSAPRFRNICASWDDILQKVCSDGSEKTKRVWGLYNNIIKCTCNIIWYCII